MWFAARVAAGHEHRRFDLRGEVGGADIEACGGLALAVNIDSSQNTYGASPKLQRDSGASPRRFLTLADRHETLRRVVHRAILGASLLISACGLQGDWDRWEQASQGDVTGSEAAASSSASGPGDDSSETSRGTESTTSAAASTGSDGEATDGSSSETGGSMSGPGSTCGNGVVEDGEECDEAGDVHCFNCYRDRVVFVTSNGFHGDFAKSPVNSLDLYCNQLAYVAGLLSETEWMDQAWRFKAWISTTSESAKDRLFHSPGRYVLVNDLVFAESWDDIIAGNLLNTLNVDENSQTQNVPVWTGTSPVGTGVIAMDGDQCGDWTDSSVGGWAYYGFSDDLDGQWTMYADPAPCVGLGAFYCFESP